MKFLRIAAPIALVMSALATAPVSAQGCSPTASVVVAKLMKASQQREMLEKTMATMFSAMQAQMPSPAQQVMKDFLAEEMSWAKFESDIMRIYCEVYTEKEMTELVTLYESPAGQLMLRKMPEVMQKSQELSSTRMQAAMPRLMQRMQEAMAGGGAKRDTVRAPR